MELRNRAHNGNGYGSDPYNRCKIAPGSLSIYGSRRSVPPIDLSWFSCEEFLLPFVRGLYLRSVPRPHPRRPVVSPLLSADRRYRYYRLRCAMSLRYYDDALPRRESPRPTKEIRRIDNSRHSYSSPRRFRERVHARSFALFYFVLSLSLSTSIEFLPCSRSRIRFSRPPTFDRALFFVTLSPRETSGVSHFCVLENFQAYAPDPPARYYGAAVAREKKWNETTLGATTATHAQAAAEGSELASSLVALHRDDDERAQTVGRELSCARLASFTQEAKREQARNAARIDASSARDRQKRLGARVNRIITKFYTRAGRRMRFPVKLSMNPHKCSTHSFRGASRRDAARRNTPRCCVSATTNRR